MDTTETIRCCGYSRRASSLKRNPRSVQPDRTGAKAETCVQESRSTPEAQEGLHRFGLRSHTVSAQIVPSEMTGSVKLLFNRLSADHFSPRLVLQYELNSDPAIIDVRAWKGVRGKQ